MALGIDTKQPAELLDYDVTYEDWIPDGDTVVSATVTVTTADDSLTVTKVEIMTPIVKVWISGGISGTTYKITVLATTAEGRTKEAEFKLRVRDY